MIKNKKMWRKFENLLKKKERINIKNNFKIVEALYKEALELKIFPLKNPLNGLEDKIRLAKIINSVSKTH